MRKWFVLLLVLAVLLAFSACGSENGEQSTAQMDESEFLTRAAELNTEAYELATTLGSVGLFQMSFWQNLENIGGTANPESVVERGFDWLEEDNGMTPDSVQADFDRLYAEYTALLDASVTGEDVTEIQGELSALFAHFTTIYETVTEPGTVFDSFVRNMHAGTSGVMESYERLNELL